MSSRDFASEAAALAAMMETQRSDAVARLRALHEAWARSLIGIDDGADLVPAVRAAVEAGVDPRAAIAAGEKLAAAEQHQWEIGTWSSGSGEGLASMFEVRSLQVAQAWLCLASAATDEAERLALAARDDANRIAARHAEDIAALLERVGG